MLHRDASPAIAPATHVVNPSSAPTSSQPKEASGPSAMEVDSGASTELAVVGEQETQESSAHQMAEAPAKDAMGSGKAVVEGGTSAEGGASAPKTGIEFPKIVYPTLTPSSSALAPGAARHLRHAVLRSFSDKQTSCKETAFPSASCLLRALQTSRS